jgi:hypothetical protein
MLLKARACSLQRATMVFGWVVWADGWIPIYTQGRGKGVGAWVGGRMGVRGDIGLALL